LTNSSKNDKNNDKNIVSRERGYGRGHGSTGKKAQA
jgi:hypothetical protein